MHRVGVSPEPIEWYKLNADNLSANILKTLSDKSIKTKAKDIGAKVAKENGVQNAVEIFNRSFA